MENPQSQQPQIILTNKPADHAHTHTAAPNERDGTTYSPDSAAGRMIQRFPIVPQHFSVSETLAHLARNIRKFETINYIYVLTTERKLIGTVSIKELLQAHRRTKLEKIITKDLITVHPETDQETVVTLATKHRLKQLPVVDENGIFLGVVPSDALLDILNEEFSEDILRLAGAPEFVKNPEKMPVLRWTALRLPWLLVGLCGGIISGIVIGIFRPTLEQFLVLSIYLPIMMRTGGDVGMQSATVFIRTLAIRKQKQFFPYLIHEIKSGVILGLLWGGFLFLISIFWQKFLLLAVIAGVSILLTVPIAACAGAVLPYIFYKIKIDPALASNPLISAIQDILGLIIYLGIATALFGIISPAL